MIIRQQPRSIVVEALALTVALSMQWSLSNAQNHASEVAFHESGSTDHARSRGLWRLQTQPTRNRESTLPPIDTFVLDQVEPPPSDNHFQSYPALLGALATMQSHFFQVSHGTWPKAIDWTAAVMGTHVSSTLAAMTDYAQSMFSGFRTLAVKARDHENLINRYFTQITSFYFGENAFSLRTQAYDDMLWVVLDWLESIKFINQHSSFHYSSPSTARASNPSQWYAHQFVPQFAHRARLFYDLASRGWDTTLCGGGMIWSPYLAPYKNAITNELYITASVSMYLNFPGDSNPSPFYASPSNSKDGLPPVKGHDKRYLQNAVEGYRWLKASGMQNGQGLYIDGFHISGWRDGKDASNGTGECDLRAEKVYTYNQGVILSGLRGLWEATGSMDYLLEAHELVRNVISATGFHSRDKSSRWEWAGLGRNGVLEEACDSSGTCSQDAQTFKGIFFHHFTLFCSPLPFKEGDEHKPWLGDRAVPALHRKSCDEYGEWVELNARAATVTKDENGEFGMWWGRPSKDGDEVRKVPTLKAPDDQGVDYRNQGVPEDEIWRLSSKEHDSPRLEPRERERVQEPFGATEFSSFEKHPRKRDINDRGRGRTVETQSGGVAVLKAFWKLVESRRL